MELSLKIVLKVSVSLSKLVDILKELTKRVTQFLITLLDSWFFIHI